jgi:hypothetical protein
VGQVDAVATVQSPEISQFARLMRHLEQTGFQCLLDYAVQDNVVYKDAATTTTTKRIVVALKDSDSRAQWFQNEAQVNLALATRLVPISADDVPLYFDGATMMQYQFTSRIVEEAWCHRRYQNATRNDVWCQHGHGFSPDLINIPRSFLSVRPSAVANGGRGVYSTQRIPLGSTLALDDYVNQIFVPSATTDLMFLAANRFESVSSFWSTVYLGYIDGYGYGATDYVR